MDQYGGAHEHFVFETSYQIKVENCSNPASKACLIHVTDSREKLSDVTVVSLVRVRSSTEKWTMISTVFKILLLLPQCNDPKISMKLG